ncbi:MAG: hypothetical protein FIA94_00030 [Nitrospirae bacterium]|nr:hypothetical protein [Nitrospirota bacterium]
MKRILGLSFCLVLAFAAVSFAAGAGLTGTQHDLSGGTGEICVACHTPHAAVASTSGPLWNRTQTSPTYRYYSNATFEMDSPALALGAQSLACMTCHNGVASSIVNGPGSGVGNVAPYALGASATNTIGANSFSNIGWGALDNNNALTNDHPVGFTYVPGTDLQNNGFPAIDAGNNNITGTAMPTFAGKIECATCHDVHNQAYAAGANEVNFLRQATAGSAMCIACHVTKG